MTENQIIEQLNNLHSKILRSPFSKNVTESEIMALIESKKAIEEFKDLKEKSVAKKPIRNDLCTCPSCGTHNEIIKKRRSTVAFDTVYCWHCGQAIEIERD